MLHRFSVRPGQTESFLELWRQVEERKRRNGFHTLTANIGLSQSQWADAKFSWCYSCPDDWKETEKHLLEDNEYALLAARCREYCYTNDTLRRVEQVYMSQAAHESDPGKTTIMRRYNIKHGEWDAFLDLWRRIVPVRQRFGFRCIFAFADTQGGMFTWAFDYDGQYKDFVSMQQPYYEDPERVQLEGILNYMTDILIYPARQIATN